MYTLHTTKQFEKDFKLCVKRGLAIPLLSATLEILEQSGKLPAKYKQHKLRGDYVHYWECHIQPDWLLIWYSDEKAKEIHLIRTGTHSDLF